MFWTDIHRIAEALCDTHPEMTQEGVQYMSFPRLQKMVLALPDFKDTPDRCGEKILEAIQAAWLEEI